MALPGLLWLGWVSLGACQNMCMCIPPSKTQRDTNPTQDTIYTLACLRAKGVVKKLNCPLVGSWVLLSLSRLLPFGPNTAYSARLRVCICRGRNGRIMDESTQKRSNDTKIRQNDGLEIFQDNTPEQNPIVHQKHIFIKIIVISRFFKSRNSYA